MEASPPRRRLRFSLQTLLLLLAIAAMGIVIRQMYAELVPMRAELRRLRDEVGELTIEDNAKFHAILSPRANPDEFRWRWRIWVPEGRHYQLNFVSDKIPKSGLPQPRGMIRIDEPGEQWIEYHVFREAESGKWLDMVYTKNASVTGTYQEWPDWNSRVGAGQSVADETKVFEPDERIEIVRWHMSQATSSANIEDPSAGYMIWLESVP